MVYFHGLRDVPAWVLTSKNKYHLVYEVLGQHVKVPLKWDSAEVGEDGLVRLKMERIKVFYLFGESREAIKAYIK